MEGTQERKYIDIYLMNSLKEKKERRIKTNNTFPLISRCLPTPSMARTSLRTLPHPHRLALQSPRQQPRILDRSPLRLGKSRARRRCAKGLHDLSQLLRQRRHGTGSTSGLIGARPSRGNWDGKKRRWRWQQRRRQQRRETRFGGEL